QPTAKSPTANAEPCTARRDQEKSIALVAPSAAPADTPSSDGDTSGLRRSAWKAAPPAASAPPTRSAAKMRRSRAARTTVAVFGLASEVPPPNGESRILRSSECATGNRPTANDDKKRTTHAAARAPSTSAG